MMRDTHKEINSSEFIALLEMLRNANSTKMLPVLEYITSWLGLVNNSDKFMIVG